MSEINKNETVASDIPADGLPDQIATPSDTLVQDKPKKEVMQIGTSMKVGLGFMGLAGAFFVWQMFFAGSPTQQQSGGMPTQTAMQTSGFDRARAAEKSVDPEAARLDELDKLKKAEEAAKRGESYMVVEPFGAGNNTTADISGAKAAASNEGNAVVMTMAAPPPPMQAPQPPQDGGQGGERRETPQDRIEKHLAKMFVVAPPGVSLGSPPPIRQVSAQMGQTGVAGIGPGQTSQRPANMYEIPAGTELFAELTSGLNSLVPETPARAVVLGGRFNGAIMTGKVTTKENKYMVVQMTQMSLGKFTWPIEAIVVSSETGQAGLADEVDNRYIERYALGAGMGFVQALGAAVMQEGTQSQTIIGPTGSTTTSNNPTLTSKQKLLIGLGGAGQSVSPGVQEYQSSIKPEVKVYSNKEVKVIFTKPFNP